MPDSQPDAAVVSGPRDYDDLITYFEGDYRPWNEAKVHVFTPAVKYGAGVFEGVRGYWSEARGEMVLFRLAEHLKRLEYSQRVMRFDRVFTAEEVTVPVLEVMRRNAFREHVHVRPTVYVGGDGESGSAGPADLTVTAVRRGKKKSVETGASVQVSSWQRISDLAMPARVKAHANYNNSRMSSMQAKNDGYDTTLMLNRNGHVSEGPGMCFFMIRDGVPITPTVTSDILESITRDTVIRLLGEEMGLRTVEREIDRSELYACEEAFFCGTAWEITPITQFDGIPVGAGGIGPIAKRLTQVYFDLVTGAVEDTRGWLTAV
ncbi:MAG: branched-chain amino acid transaminase [Rhodospirillaceae bacterium]